jgi:Secretion system C-terminal sorting domain
MKYKLTIIVLLVFQFSILAQNKILFDATKAEMAGNADWVIDADLFNISFSGGPASIGGSESNPQRIPTPAQSGVTASTTESFWKGGISAWAIDCAKLGYLVETLPYSGQITYGNSTNLQDLSNYKVFVLVEPNIQFTSTEKIAIINFVQNGGGLFIIADHNISDRNNDGFDAPLVLNDLVNNNSVAVNPFGIVFDNNNTSNITSSNIANLPLDPVINGSFGSVTQLKYSQGSSMTINTSVNSNAKGLIYTTGSSTTGSTNILFATSTFGSGKIAALGDSSPADDGTGDTNDTLYFGYSDLAGNHQKLIMNATVWLISSNLQINNFELNENNFYVAQNPINNKELKLNYVCKNNASFSVIIYDSMGRIIQTSKFSNSEIGPNFFNLELQDLNSGIYFCKINSDFGSKSLRFIVK